MNEKLMSDSLTPWDSEPDVLQSKKSKPQTKVNTSSNVRINRYNSQGSRVRAATSQTNRPKPQKQVIKLQQRVPTQSNKVVDWQVELKQFKNELIFKIPPTFLTIGPKKSSSSSKIRNQKNFYKRQDQLCRQKVSFLNFKKEIEQLDRLKITKRFFSNSQPQPKLKNLMKVSEAKGSSVLRFTAKSIELFQERPNDLGTRQTSGIKLSEQSIQKKHILDRLLSKFQ